MRPIEYAMLERIVQRVRLRGPTSSMAKNKDHFRGLPYLKLFRTKTDKLFSVRSYALKREKVVLPVTRPYVAVILHTLLAQTGR